MSKVLSSGFPAKYYRLTSHGAELNVGTLAAIVPPRLVKENNKKPPPAASRWAAGNHKKSVETYRTLIAPRAGNNVRQPYLLYKYKALAELGKARKTTFLCRYLHLLSLRREIHEGLNVVENWNSANDFILYGRGGEIATNRIEDQDITVLALHLLQVSLVYINTLMIQRVLSESAWVDRMTAEVSGDLRR